MIIRQILCPIDFSDAPAHAVDHAIALGPWYGARVEGLTFPTSPRSLEAVRFAGSLAREAGARC